MRDPSAAGGARCDGRMEPHAPRRLGLERPCHRPRPRRWPQAEAQTLAFVQQYCPQRTSPLCGNSIWQDRRFLARYMPQLEGYLHYRNIDVSTVKELVRRWYPNGPQPPEKKHAHLALDDIRESIAELQFYREHYFGIRPHE